MSDFRELRVVFNKGERFVNVNLNEDHDTYRFEGVYSRLIGAGYEMVSVVIDGNSFEYEALKDLSSERDVIELFDQLKESDYDAHTIAAWLTVDESANFSNMTYAKLAEGSCLEYLWAAVEEYQEEMLNIPSWVVLDAEETVTAYADYYGYELVEFEGWFYIFDLNY
jgi:hypothetical protein